MTDQRTKPTGAVAPAHAAPLTSAAKPAATMAPAPAAKPASMPVVAAPAAKAAPVASVKVEAARPVTPPAPQATKATSVQAKPAPVAPKIEQAAKATPAPAPVAMAKAAPKPKRVVRVARAARPVAKAPPVTVPKIATPKIAKAIKQAAPRALARTEGSKIMNEAVNKVQDNAKKFTAEAGTRAQAMMGDVTERARGAYEKSVKMAEDMTEFQKGNVEAMVESTKLVAKGAESLGQEAADYARKSFEHGSAAFKTFASAKSPTDLFKLQSDFMKSSFDAAVAESSKMTEAWLKLAGEIVQPMSNRVAVAMEKARATAL